MKSCTSKQERLIEVSIELKSILPIAITEGIGNWPLHKDSFHQVQEVVNRHNSFLHPFTEIDA